MINDTLFQIQSDVIRKLTEEGPCVLVGRCTDYILRKEKNCFNIFIHAPLSNRVETVRRREAISEQAARELILKMDKIRSSYYNYYTSKKWGDTSSYDLTINTSKISVDNAVDLILDFRKYMDMKTSSGII